MASLKFRSEQTELMDDLNCSGSMLQQTLQELEFINKWLGGNAVTVDAIRKLFEGKQRNKTYTIGDVGCGGGDLLHLIHTWGQQNSLNFNLVGVDANPNIIGYAIKNSQNFPGIDFRTMNIFSSEFKNIEFDVIIGTLFFHHFSERELVSFFKALRSHVRIGFIINDIHRHPLAYYSIKALTRLFSKSAMVVNDAPLSVQRAFKKQEIIRILSQAGYVNYSIKWKWAFRWQVLVYTA